ncbi:tyrosine-type recombinase/integrase [Nonomuraea mangrovi]|uniref:Tyrosine-type recombinase/integrase n=1 Tax=Nonomuraea mangrovi TaxID=2316207 RepID=A0ABW4SVD9_9ACTN
MESILRQAGVRDARVRDARHTAAALLIEQGVHISVVQEILGHTRVTTIERYTRRHHADEGRERPHGLGPLGITATGTPERPSPGFGRGPLYCGGSGI